VLSKTVLIESAAVPARTSWKAICGSSSSEPVNASTELWEENPSSSFAPELKLFGKGVSKCYIFFNDTSKIMFSKHLPMTFQERFSQVVPPQSLATAALSFATPPPLMVRINTLKADASLLPKQLDSEGVSYRPISEIPKTYIIEGMTSRELGEKSWIKDGHLYRQSLSSMLPVQVLDPHPDELILDMCAAPGSKTSQIAAHMHNQGTIVAIEAVRSRYYKLKTILDLLGVTCVCLKRMDARRYHNEDQPFDRILVDAPCSAEGRFREDDPQTYRYWSPRKIKEMVRKQRGLLRHALRLLKPGGILVYATCTFAPEENEGVIDWILRKAQGTLSVEPIKLSGVPRYPTVPGWQKKVYHPQIVHCCRVLPDGLWEGFFIAKLQKNPS
jgi:16S rRNA (cytosine1407-C5)-methyltransferase